jgi:hypothetical protein
VIVHKILTRHILHRVYLVLAHRVEEDLLDDPTDPGDFGSFFEGTKMAQVRIQNEFRLHIQRRHIIVRKRICSELFE